MQNETPIEVEAEDKLRWLHRLDGTREWESLRFRRPYVARVKRARHVLVPVKQQGNWTSKIRHALQRHFGLPV